MLTCAGGRVKGRRERTSVPPHCFIIERVKRAEGRVWHLLPDPVRVRGACKDGTAASASPHATTGARSDESTPSMSRHERDAAIRTKRGTQNKRRTSGEQTGDAQHTGNYDKTGG